jgi:hypothetical protein
MKGDMMDARARDYYVSSVMAALFIGILVGIICMGYITAYKRMNFVASENGWKLVADGKGEYGFLDYDGERVVYGFDTILDAKRARDSDRRKTEKFWQGLWKENPKNWKLVE